jgi:hypothetical protein
MNKFEKMLERNAPENEPSNTTNDIDTIISNLTTQELIDLSEECNKPSWNEWNILRRFVKNNFDSDSKMPIIVSLTLANKFLIETTKRLKNSTPTKEQINTFNNTLTKIRHHDILWNTDIHSLDVISAIITK